LSAAPLGRRVGAPRRPPLAEVRDLRRLRTAVRSGLRGVTSAPLVFGLSVATMAAGLLLLSAYLLVVQNVRVVVASYASELSLVAFLPAGADASAIVGLRGALEGLDDVEGVAFVSSDRALARLRGDLGSDAGVLDGLSHNPLPASFEIRLRPEARTPERLRDLALRAGSLAGVDEVRYGEAWVESYARLLGALQWLGLGLGACIVLVLGVIVSGTVRLAVHARADEIQIQRLVGGGAFFVRLPFYLEAGLQGALGAGVALALLYGLFRLGPALIGESVPLLFGAEPVFFGSMALSGLVVFAIALGVAAAVLSLAWLEEEP
jgi:cell division transport system permease protein